jgi:hypothetical protein
MLLYLEADDEITTVVRRLRESDGESVILVAPGRAKALTSSVALRLLASIAADQGRAVALVADATTRSLASEAGIATYASVADAEQGVAATIVPPTRAQIHVVQGDEPTAHAAAQAAPAPRRNELDDTRAVPIATTPVRKRARRVPWLAVAGALALLLVAGVAGAVVAPAATIHLAPQAEVVGPKTYDLTLTPDVLSGTLRAKTTGHATGKYVDRTAATGVVLFQNFNTYPVDVPAGAQVAAGEIVFATTEAVTVPPGTFVGAIQSGDKAAPVVAAAPGPAGNVGAGAINRVVDPQLDARLQGYPTISEPRVRNSDATAGGKEASGPQIKKEDVDAAAAALRKDLEGQLTKVLGDQSGRLSPVTAAPAPVITVAKGLVGTRDRAIFELAGTLAYDHRSVQVTDVEVAARERLVSDATAIPAGTELLADTVQVTPGEITVAGDRLRAPARVTAQSAPRLDPVTVRNRVAGLSADAARSALSEYGSVDLNLWPGWVRTVPSLSWRIEVIIDPVRRG